MSPDDSDPNIVHVSSVPVILDAKLVQRCAWCGALLLAQDMPVPIPQDFSVKIIPVGQLIRIDRSTGMYWLLGTLTDATAADTVSERCVRDDDEEPIFTEPL